MTDSTTAPGSRDRLAEELRGFGPLGVLAMLVIVFAGNTLMVPLGAILALTWARWSRTPWRELGFVRPRSWIVTVIAGVVLGVTFKLLMKSVVMPLLGADPINPAFHHLVGNHAALPMAIYTMIVVAGFGEETVFRGYLFERLGKLLGSSAWARAGIVLITAAWFGVAHISLQGLPGVQQATLVGLVFGAIYAGTGRIWLLMIAHAAFDLTALAVIYWDLEREVAQWFFGPR